MFELVIFDCDGVLIDSELIACRVVAGCLSARGYALEAADIVPFIGKSSRDMVATLTARFGRALPDDFDSALAEQLREAFARELQAMAGVAALLDRLHDRAICVASSSNPARIRHSLSCVGLLERFGDQIFSATMVERGKPAPDLFLHAAARMGFPPSACAVIEDSVPGVQAAVAAGMTAFGFTGGSHCRLGHASGLRRAGAREIARTIDALRPLLRIRGAGAR